MQKKKKKHIKAQRQRVLLYLSNIHHVCHESKAFKFELGDVCLEQHINLK